MIHPTFKSDMSLASCLLFLGGLIPYIKGILSANKLPRKVSISICALLATITFISMYVKNAAIGQIFAAMLGLWILAGLAIIWGKPGWVTLDGVGLVAALASLLLWYVFGSPILAIVISQSALVICLLSTLKPSWRSTNQQKLALWVVWVSSLLAFIAMSDWTLHDSFQPVIFCIGESIILLVISFPKGQRGKNRR